MKCPKCGSEDIGVTCTIPGGKRSIYRERKCKECGEKFRTVEAVDNGSEAFATGFSRAQRKKKNKYK